MRNTLAIIAGTMRIQMKNSFARPMFQFCLIVSPIANTILLYYMFRNSAMDNFITYVVVGAGMSSLWECICFSSIGDINRERWSGTLSLIFTAPAGFNLIILGKLIGNTVLSLVTFAITLVVAAFLSGTTLVVANAGWMVLALVLALVAFVVLSQVFAYLLTLSRKTEVLMNCLSIPIALLCGFVVEIEYLPTWVQPISYLLPPTWAVKLIRGCLDGGMSDGEFRQTAMILCVQILVYIVLCNVLYKFIERQVKIDASLEMM